MEIINTETQPDGTVVVYVKNNRGPIIKLLKTTYDAMTAEVSK